jgi:hypothetical protein
MVFCEHCQHEFSSSNWSAHIKTKKHLRNVEDPNYQGLSKVEKHRIACQKYYNQNHETINSERREIYYSNGRQIRPCERK